MSVLNFQKTRKLEDLCLKIFENQGVNFAGIINRNGKLIAGGFKKNSEKYEKEKLFMIFLELYLDYSMRKEFDNDLGKISYMTTMREQTNVTTIPFENELILIFSNPETRIENLVEKINIIFNKFLEHKFSN